MTETCEKKGAAKVAFVGLGVMGYPMAGHLKRDGHDVVVFNRTHAKAEKWVAEHGGRSTMTPCEAAQDRDFVFVCVGNDDDVRSVFYGENGILAGMHTGAVLIDSTTDSAALSRELEAACRQKGIGFLDAPVSGGQSGAENGTLTVMVGGSDADFDAAKPVIDAYASVVTHMGPAGCGQLTKMVNQVCIAGVLQSLSEGLAFGLNAGLDMKKVVEAISKGCAGSWQMDNRSETMVEGKFNFGFAVDWMRKDLRIVLAEAERNGSKMPLTKMVEAFYGDLQTQGDGRLDTSSLIKLLPIHKA